MVLQFGWTVLLPNLERVCRNADPDFPDHVIGRVGIIATLVLQVLGALLSFYLPYISLVAGTLIIVMYIFRPTRGEWQAAKNKLN